MTRPVNLIDAAKYYKGEVHQNSAWLALQDSLSDAQLDLFSKLYRGLQRPVRNRQKGFPLEAEYYYQRDSKTGHGERSCQASAIAMVLEYIDSRIIDDDDDYLKLVLQFGDTVSQLAHKKALDSIGVKNQFRMNGTVDDLYDLLIKGYPVPIGVLHRGHYESCSGGGHWITLIGFDERYFQVHDPFGRMDLINGDYISTGPTDGKGVLYEREQLMSRWLIDSDCDGWFWDLSKNALK